VTSNMPSPPEDTVRAPRTAVGFNNTHAFFIVVDGRSTISVGQTFYELAVFCRDVVQCTHAASLDGGGSSAMWVKGKGIVNVPSDGSERATCNGLMMVDVKPRESSATFETGALIRATASTQLRTGPGTNYPVIGNATADQTGTVVGHHMNGARATNQFWWKWQSAGVEGWTSQNSLEVAPTAADLWTLY
jgi:hypothetical protein